MKTFPGYYIEIYKNNHIKMEIFPKRCIVTYICSNNIEMFPILWCLDLQTIVGNFSLLLCSVMIQIQIYEMIIYIYVLCYYLHTIIWKLVIYCITKYIQLHVKCFLDIFWWSTYSHMNIFPSYILWSTYNHGNISKLCCGRNTNIWKYFLNFMVYK